jgi:glycosyltransferase involved in cell wall biosynthesis
MSGGLKLETRGTGKLLQKDPEPKKQKNRHFVANIPAQIGLADLGEQGARIPVTRTSRKSRGYTAFQVANLKLREGQFAEAIKLYETLIDEYPAFKDVIQFNLDFAKRRSQKNPGAQVTPKQTKALTVTASPITFDRDYYLEKNKDVRHAGVDPESHYWSSGEREGRWPNAHFDPVFYLNINADIRAAKISPFQHYSASGYREGRLGESPIHDYSKERCPKTKSLLFVGHDGMLAGAQVLLLEIVRWFFESTTRRIKVLLLGFGPLVDRYVQMAEVYTLMHATVDDPTKLRKFLEEDFQFAYLNSIVSGRLLPILESNHINLSSPIIANIHEMADSLEKHSSEIAHLRKKASHWISGSPLTTIHLTERFAVLPKDISTIPAFIRPLLAKQENPFEQKKAARQKLEINLTTCLVMACGTAVSRKGPDLFVDTAKKLRAQTKHDFCFVWIGDGEEKAKLEKMLSPEENSFIKFIGTRRDADFLLAAADVFYLSSREDPFPLVVLSAAQYSIPTVCFSPATGATAFVQDDAGITLPDADTSLAASAILGLINAPHKRLQSGNIARNRLYESYTVDTKMLETYDVIQKHTGYVPSVSVIVPFYNHQKYVDERLSSILEQSIKDIEVIALDDCSSDDTVAQIHPYLQKDKRLTLVKNTTNSGSPFRQWQKGIALAKSDVVWVAEGDDSCSGNFIATLLPNFSDPLINIAFSKVEMMDEEGVKNPDAFKAYFDSACPGKFESPYVNSGINEVKEHFCAYQTLINASGLMFRKSRLCPDAFDLAISHRVCGDWLVYLGLLKSGKIVYCPSAVNYFRRHNKSLVSVLEGTADYFKERFDVTRYIIKNFSVEHAHLEKAFLAVDAEWERFKKRHPQIELEAFYDKKILLHELNEKKRLPSLLVVASDLSPGGGQMFSIRLANAWRKRGGTVVLLNIDKYKRHPKVINKILKSVPVYEAADVDLVDLVNIYGIEVIHSAIWWADKYVCENYERLNGNAKWIVTTHGCYETLLGSKHIDESFPIYLTEMLKKVNFWVYTADKNLAVFHKYGMPKNIKKLRNGYEPELVQQLDRVSLGIRHGAIVACLASRAIREKGWFAARDAVMQLNQEGLKVDLLLIGEGPAAIEIRSSGKPDYIHLIDQVDNLQDYISIADIGLLPSMFIGESLPLVLIEFMAQAKPILTTDVGEITDMTTHRGCSAAIIIKLVDGEVDIAQLAAGLRELVTDSNKRAQLGNCSATCFKSFEMNEILDDYHKIYTEVLQCAF